MHTTAYCLRPIYSRLVTKAKHEVLFALEMLAKSSLADPHIRQHLVDADTSEPIAVEATNGRFYQALAGWSCHSVFTQPDRG